MATPLPFPSLDENPRLHFASFERHVYDDAGSTCTDLFPHGLLFLVVSDQTWAALPNNSTTADGITTINPRPTFLAPIQPPDNATTGVWKAFETRRKLFDTFSAASLLLLRRIKLTLPPADVNLLSHPILGLVNFSALSLMEHLRQQYGTFQATDFALLFHQLEEKVTSATDFSTVAARFRLVFEQFSAHNQPISELQQCSYLSNAIEHVPHLVKTQDTYFQRFPDPTNRRFLQLVNHITLHAPNFVQTSADLGYVASAIIPATPDPITTFLASAQFATIVATAAAAAVVKLPPVASRASHKSALRPRLTSPSSPRLYCFLHGYDWHSGIDCKKMAKDPASYPQGAQHATSHSSVVGGNTTKL